jgi:hypothetical protein
MKRKEVEFFQEDISIKFYKETVIISYVVYSISKNTDFNVYDK